MLGRFSLDLTSGRRLAALAGAAVLVPALLLIFVQYRSLVNLQEKTKGAVKENLRQTLLNINRQIEGEFEDLGIRSLLPIGELKFSNEEERKSLESHFASVIQVRPEVEQIFVFSSYGSEIENNSYAYIYTPGGLQRIEHSNFADNEGIHNAFHSYEKAQAAESYLDSKSKFLFWQDSCPICLKNGNKHLSAFIFYPLRDNENQKHFGFAGLVLNTNYVKNQFLTLAISKALQSPNLAASSDLAVGITDENKNEIYTNTPDRREYEIKDAFARPFSNWEIGVGLKNTDVESLARRTFWESLLLMFLVMAVLLAGILLMLHATDRAVKLAQAKSAFVSNVSHELKTPLALIRLFAEILELGRLKNEDKAREYYRIINDESRRLTQLIDNILDFSKIEAGRKEYNFVSTNVSEAIETVVSSYKYRIVNAGFELTTKIEKNLPTVMADNDALSQAVLNLLDNAVKYSKDEKQISVTVEKRNSRVAIEVSDKGIGITKAEQKKIFEKFYRVSNGLVHDRKGSGLGLALVKHIVEAHNGEISVFSVPGEGSRFTILIPFDRY